MKLLLDTQLLLWAAGGSDRLSTGAIAQIEDLETEPIFSAASIWEVAIKSALGRPEFRTDASELRRELLENGFKELPITGAHAAYVAGLPSIHRDPFDRILVAQAIVEGIGLLTADATILSYPGPIRPAV